MLRSRFREFGQSSRGKEMKNIGLHFRFKDTITEVIDQAFELKVPIFQCFFTDYIHKKQVEVNPQVIETFRRLSQNVKRLYAHGSYLINLADDREHYILKRELELSRKLGFKYLILHPGAFKPAFQTLEQGIDSIVKNVNKIMKHELDITLILENTAFGGSVIGGDFRHFDSIFNRLDFPERVRFCLDTAHAYVYGYDLNNNEMQKSFLEMLKSSSFRNFIQLIHLNNSSSALSSGIDSHAILFEGKIAPDNLKTFVKDSLFSTIDLILEMPEISKERKKDILIEVASWF